MAWIRYWTFLARLEASAQVVPILGIAMPDADPGWSDYPPDGWIGYFARRRNRAVWEATKKIESICESNADTAKIQTLRLLAPIQRAEGATWLREIGPRLDRAGSGYRTDAQRTVDRLYDSPAAREYGVNHFIFRKAINQAFSPI